MDSQTKEQLKRQQSANNTATIYLANESSNSKTNLTSHSAKFRDICGLYPTQDMELHNKGAIKRQQSVKTTATIY